MGTYPSIKSWLAVQMNSLKLIQDDQMAEKSDFWSNWSPNRPRWPPGGPAENFEINSDGQQGFNLMWEVN